MSDEVVGTAVLVERHGPDRTREYLSVCCLAEAGRRAGKRVLITIPVSLAGDGETWTYEIIAPGRLRVHPSLLCRESKWDETTGKATDEMIQVFHNGSVWEIPYEKVAECEDNGYSRFRELNPGSV